MTDAYTEPDELWIMNIEVERADNLYNEGYFYGNSKYRADPSPSLSHDQRLIWLKGYADGEGDKADAI